jgi:hypothetical protein
MVVVAVSRMEADLTRFFAERHFNDQAIKEAVSSVTINKATGW